jgi:hypothetical protein
VRYFVKSGLIPADQMNSYSQIIGRAQELRNSLTVEVAILCFAFSTSAFGLSFVPHDNNSWHFIDGHLTMAGMWSRFVALPAFRFAWLGWCWRMAVWYYVLARISMLNLKLVPTHPDCRGGLGFLSSGHNNFAILAFAISCQVSAVMGEEILYNGHTINDLKATVLLIIIIIVAISILPLAIFTPKLIACKRLGLYQYGILAKQQVDRYHSKVVHDEDQIEDGPAADIIEPDPKAQDNFKAVGNMQITVFDKNAVSTFTVAAAAPFAPLLLTIYKFDQLLDQILKKLL